MVKFIVISSMCIMAMVIYYLVEKRSISSKIVRQILNDQEVIEAFKSTSMTGMDFLKYILSINGIKYKIYQSKKSKTVWCLPGSLVVSQSFSDPLTVESFNTTMHELKHILDKKITNMKYFIDLVCALLFIIILIDILQIAHFENIKIFYKIGLASYIIMNVLNFIGETRARQFVNSEYSKNILLKMNFQKNINIKIIDYLKVRIKNEIIWHNATTLSMSLCVLSVLIAGML